MKTITGSLQVLLQSLASMDTKHILMLLSITLNAQCNCTKNWDCATTKYQFELGVHAIPDLKTLKVGDTLYVVINDSTTLLDQRSNQNVNYSGVANLGSFISFQEIDSTTRLTKNCMEKFGFIVTDGVILNNTSQGLGQEYRFIERNNKFRFKLGLICKQAGIYDILLSNSGNTYRASDKCTKANFEMVFQNTSVHYELLPWYTGGPSRIGGQYVFEVR